MSFFNYPHKCFDNVERRRQYMAQIGEPAWFVLYTLCYQYEEWKQHVKQTNFPHTQENKAEQSEFFVISFYVFCLTIYRMCFHILWIAKFNVSIWYWARSFSNDSTRDVEFSFLLSSLVNCDPSMNNKLCRYIL